MQIIRDHLALRNPRFVCKDTSEKHELTVSLLSIVGKPGFQGLENEELYEFQRDGFAFATIAASDNYFVIYEGKIYYS